MEPGLLSESEFEELLRRHAPGLASLLRRSARSPDLRGDALQESLARAWAGRASYDATRPFGPWLATIALRVARDLARARERRPDRESLDVKIGGSDDGAGHAEPSASGADPAATVELNGEVARLMAAVEELPAAAQTAFLRFHRDGATLQEIAEEMELPLNTVKSHLRRARLKLSARLAARLGGRPQDGSS